MSMTAYLWLKAFHLIAVISWMAGMLYLPRLYVYHAGVAAGSEASEMLKIMERKLLRVILTPAMLATWLLGLCLAVNLGASALAHAGWFHLKLLLVLALTGFHGLLARWRKDFAQDKNHHTARFYRMVNEIPAVIMVVIVLLVIIKPF